jgi:ABC-2 type transport system permease protein
VTRFARQRNRLIGALGQPILFWVLFGAGLRSSFRPDSDPSLSYGEYFFPGVLVLIVLFTAIFATISIIEDRREGFLQGVLIAPVPRSMIVLGKVLGGTVLALLQAWIFLAIAMLTTTSVSATGFLLASAHLFVVGIGLTSLGVALAWRMDSTQGFHAIMSVFLMPMWLLSGAFFPAAGAPGWLAGIIRCNPVTYAVAGLRRILYLDQDGLSGWPELPSLGWCGFVSVTISCLMFAIAVRVAGRHSGEER